MDKIIKQWIYFLLTEEKPKTKVWEIRTIEKDDLLGYIKWYPRWRKYSFFPCNNTVYENTCLHDIADFIKEQMRLRKDSF